MPKEVLHISSFLAGTKTTPSETDITLDTAAYSVNVDPVAEDGKLIPIPEDNKYLAPAVGGMDIDHADILVDGEMYGVVGNNKTRGRLQIQADIYGGGEAGYSEISSPVGKDATSVRNNKELHIGYGKDENAKWLGKVTGKQYNEQIEGIQYLDAELNVPGDFGTMRDSFSLGGYTYAISYGGKRLYKFTFSDETFVHTDIEFSYAVAICPNQANDGIWVYDRDQGDRGTLYKYNLSLTRQITCPLVANEDSNIVSTRTIVESKDKIWFQAPFSGTNVTETEKFIWNIAIPSSSGAINPDDRTLKLGYLDADSAWKIYNAGNKGGSFVPAITGDETLNTGGQHHSPFLIDADDDGIKISMHMNEANDKLQFYALWAVHGIGLSKSSVQEFTAPSSDHTVWAVDYVDRLIWVFSTNENAHGNGPIVLEWSWSAPNLTITEVNIRCSNNSTTADKNGGAAGLGISDWCVVDGPTPQKQTEVGVGSAVVDSTNKIVFFTINNIPTHSTDPYDNVFSYPKPLELDTTSPDLATGSASSFIYSIKYTYNDGSNFVEPDDYQIEGAWWSGSAQNYAYTFQNEHHATEGANFYFWNTSMLPPDMAKVLLESSGSSNGLGTIADTDDGKWAIPMNKMSLDTTNRMLFFRGTGDGNDEEYQWYTVKYQEAGAFNRPFEEEASTGDLAGYIKYLGHYDSNGEFSSTNKSFFVDVKIDTTNSYVHILDCSGSPRVGEKQYSVKSVTIADFNAGRGTKFNISTPDGWYGNVYWYTDIVPTLETFIDQDGFGFNYIVEDGIDARANAMHIDVTNKRMLIELDYDNDDDFPNITAEDTKPLDGYRILSFDVDNHSSGCTTRYVWIDDSVDLGTNYKMCGGTVRQTLAFFGTETIIYLPIAENADGDWIQQLYVDPTMSIAGTHNVYARCIQTVWKNNYKIDERALFRLGHGSTERDYVGLICHLYKGEMNGATYGEEFAKVGDATAGYTSLRFIVIILFEDRSAGATPSGSERYLTINGTNDYKYITYAHTNLGLSAQALTMFQYADSYHDRTHMALITGVVNEELAANSNLEITTTIKHKLFTKPTVSLTYASNDYTFYILGGRSVGYYYRVFETDELIASDAADNRTFDNDEGDWVLYNPDGFLTGSAVENSNKLTVTTTTDNAAEGAKLPIIHVGNGSVTSIVAGQTYRVSMDIQMTTPGSGTMSTKIGLGGTLSDAFDITTSSVTYVKHITATNNTGDLLIQNVSATLTVFTIDNISVVGTWAPVSGAEETKKRDSFISITFAAPAGSDGMIPDPATIDYFYKLSLIYDGYQESPLSTVFVADSGSVSSWDAGRNINVTMTIVKPDLISKRVTGIKLYRASNTDTSADIPLGFYRMVKLFDLNALWTLDGSSQRVQTFLDTGDQFSSYEANTGISELVPTTTLNYQISTMLNNHHYVTDASNRYLPDAQNYIFKSRPYNFDQFDWTSDFLIMPEMITALVPFNGRLLAFSSNKTYRIDPNDFYIEDTFEGVGCYGEKSFVVTEYGLFFADNNNIYMHNGQSPTAIGDAILRNDDYSYQDRDKTVIPRVMFDSERNSALIFFKTDRSGATTDYNHAWAFNIARRRWDMWRFDDDATVGPKGFTYGKYGEMLISDGDKLRHFLGHTTNKRKYSWRSKKITCNSPTIDKTFSKLTIIGNSLNQFTTVPASPNFIKIDANIPNFTHVEDGSNGDYKLTSNRKGKFLQFQIDEQSTEIDAIGIEYRRKRKLDYGGPGGGGEA
jgi:hypothetical protein